MGNWDAPASVNPEPMKKETMKNSETKATARNSPAVNSPFGAVQLKAVGSIFSLDAIFPVPLIVDVFAAVCCVYVT